MTDETCLEFTTVEVKRLRELETESKQLRDALAEIERLRVTVEIFRPMAILSDAAFMELYDNKQLPYMLEVKAREVHARNAVKQLQQARAAVEHNGEMAQSEKVKRLEAEAERDQLRARAERAEADAASLYTGICALRDWLWSGELSPDQESGAPIMAPGEVADIVKYAIYQHNALKGGEG